MPIAIDRRSFVALGAGAAASIAAGPVLAKPAASRPPNIVFILADDLGYADVSCYGNTSLKTPAIDSLASDGVRLLNGYANSPVCSATRTALITGRYQYRLPIGLEEPLAHISPDVGIPRDHPTLPSLLRAAGYRTALVGKWHLGKAPNYGPLLSGYDEFVGMRSGATDYFSHRSVVDEPDLWRGDSPLEAEGYLTEILGREATEFIERSARGKQPFFLSLHFNAPHWPWEAPDDRPESKRIAGTKLKHLDGGTMRTYHRMIEAMDAEVGRVLETLKRFGLKENTIVVFTSDNGGERFAKTWPFSGQKSELLEGGIRVPTIVSWPAMLPRGKTSTQPAITMDWLPTLLGAAKRTPDPAYPTDGIDLFPLLRSGNTAERTLYWRYKGNHQRAMLRGAYKYLRILDNEYLFNVDEDPLERANLHSRMPDVFEDMKWSWAAWNHTMLPQIDASFTEAVMAEEQADHIGAGWVVETADNPD